MHTLRIEAYVDDFHTRVTWCLLWLDEYNAMAATSGTGSVITLQCRVKNDGIGYLFELSTAGSGARAM